MKAKKQAHHCAPVSRWGVREVRSGGGAGLSIPQIYGAGGDLRFSSKCRESLWRVLSREDMISFAFLKDHSVSCLENGLWCGGKWTQGDLLEDHWGETGGRRGGQIWEEWLLGKK